MASNHGRAVSGTACISFGEKDCPKDPRAPDICHLTWWPLIKQDFTHLGCVHDALILIGLWSWERFEKKFTWPFNLRKISTTRKCTEVRRRVHYFCFCLSVWQKPQSVMAGEARGRGWSTWAHHILVRKQKEMTVLLPASSLLFRQPGTE